MLKQIAWNTFKNTGDINTFMELAKVEKAMEGTINRTLENGNYKNKRDNNCSKQYGR